MEMYQRAWERKLLSRAMDECRPVRAVARPPIDESLTAAYAHCAAVTEEHSRSFHLASGLLPEQKRHGARALYAFCRTTDDIVDKADDGSRSNGNGRADRAADKDDGKRAVELHDWRQRVLVTKPPTDDLVATAWADTRRRFGVPACYAEQLIDGVARDLRQDRYETFEELTTYCYGVAATVGLMTMHVVGFSTPEAVPYAIRLGVALQLTNILRDVGEDWRAGRVYLPRQELAAFGLDEADLGTGQVDDRWRAFMRFQIDRNRRLYDEAWPGLAMLHDDGRLAIVAAAGLYRAILGAIESNDYDVFHNRAAVNKAGKLLRLPLLWWQSKRASERIREPGH